MKVISKQEKRMRKNRQKQWEERMKDDENRREREREIAERKKDGRDKTQSCNYLMR